MSGNIQEGLKAPNSERLSAYNLLGSVRMTEWMIEELDNIK